MLFGEKTVLYSENHMKNNSTLYGENSDFFHHQSRKTPFFILKKVMKRKIQCTGKIQASFTIKAGKKTYLF
jgi:hypothetical protein